MNTLKTMARRTSLVLFFAAFLAVGLSPEIGIGQRPGDKQGRPVPSLGNVLDNDGRIKKGVVGGFDTAGFEMELDERGTPRFVPSSEIQRKKRVNPAAASPNVTGVGCNPSADPRFYNSGAYDDSSIYNLPVIAAVAVDASGNIYVGGRFAYVDNIVSYNVARYNTTTDTWSPLAGDGLDTVFGPVIIVRALAISGNDLIVGGRFTETHDGSVTNLNNIARYNLATDTWSPLAGNGLNVNQNGGGFVNALAVLGDVVYVAGGFAQTADGTTNTSLNMIAQYSLSTNMWFALTENGLFAESVNALAIWQTGPFTFDLYVGGEFDGTVAGTTPNLNNIARYTIGPNTWSQLTGNGLDSRVHALLVNPNGELYVGGEFSQTHNGAIVNLNNIARYNLGVGTWTPFAGNGLNNAVRSFAVSGNQLFVGGIFSESFNGATTNLNLIARYDLVANTWHPLTGNGLNFDSVDSMLSFAGDVYVGGYFKQTFDGSTRNINSIARFKPATAAWSFLGSNNGIGLDSTVRAVAVDASGNLYVGGQFSQTASGVMTNLNGIARYNYALNSWGGLAGNGVNGVVFALAISGNNLYVGGSFTTTADGATTLNNLGRYDTVTDTWFPMTGNGLNGPVNALRLESGILYVGGTFSQAVDGTATGNNITRLVVGPNMWFPFPNGGLNGVVRALAITNDVMYVGGDFSSTFDTTITGLNRIARFTSVWSGLPGGGLNGSVYAIAASNTEVFVGGSFAETFDSTTHTNLSNIARFNTGMNMWAALSNGGLNNDVFALTLDGDKLFLGGRFTRTVDNFTGGRRIAGYNTTTNIWSSPSFGSGFGFNFIELESDVLALSLSGSDLIIGGIFTRLANCGVANFLTRHYLLRWDAPSVLSPEGSNTEWFNAANWSTGTVPAANANAFVPANAGNISITSADVIMNDLILAGGTLTIGLNRTLTINGILNLGGTITGPGTVVITSCKRDGIMGGGTANFIQTALVRCVNSTETFNFPVGTSNGYSPVTIKNINGGGNISVKANQGAYSNPAMGLPANRLARWWQIENPGGGVISSSLFFGYLQSDISGNEYGYRAYRIAGGNASLQAGSINWFSNTATAENVTAFSDWTLAEAVPTSAGTAVGGRILTALGDPIGKAIISISDQNGNVRRALSGSLGYYRFDDVMAGQTYTLSVGSKRYQFGQGTRIITVTDDIVDLDFVALP